MRRIITAVVFLGVMALGATGLTGCEIYPSGCVRIPSNEVPFPSAWNSQTRAVHWYHDNTTTFVGISGGSPWWDFTDSWHGPTHYTGWNEYLSAMRCYQTGGASSQP